MNQRQFEEAFTRLSSLESSMPKSSEVKASYVNEFHSALNLLEEASGINLEGFRVPVSEIRRHVTAASFDMSGAPISVGYSDEYCERGILMSKISAALAFLKGSTIKRCPKCARPYSDDTLNFCLDDGTPLVMDLVTHYDPQAETLSMPAPVKAEESKVRTILKIELEDNLDRLRDFIKEANSRVNFPKTSNMSLIQRSDGLRSTPLPEFSRQRWEATATSNLIEALDNEEIKQVNGFYKELDRIIRLKREMLKDNKCSNSDWRKEFEAALNNILEKGNPLK
jgi:hypothetical protein